MKNLYKPLLIVAAVAIIFGGRWAWFYRGGYRAPEITEVEVAPETASPLETYTVFEETPELARQGYVLIDAAHTNNLAVNDLTPLRARLESRGVTVVTLGEDATTLAALLHDATALLILAPSRPYTSDECDAVAAFVEDGGRLLLAADPTHPALENENIRPTESDAFDFPSGVPAINSVANEFGITYFEDYLYNLQDNAGNYRNVKLSPAETENALTAGLESVVFFAAYSLQSDGATLLYGDADTLSTLRTGQTELAAAALSADEQVLALGDLTFLTDPYRTVADNDQLLSHIADWLAEDGRVRDELADFPYLFAGPVDVVQVSGQYVAPQLIAEGDVLLKVFEDAGIEASFRAAADPEHDALLLATYDDSEDVQELLAQSGITITLLPDDSEKETDMAEADEPSPDATETPEAEDEEETEEGESTPEAEEETEETPEEETEEKPEEEDEKDKKDEEEQKGLLEIESLGTLGQTGVTLFLLDDQDGRLTVAILAEDSKTVGAALARLVARDFSGCIQTQAVIVCSTGEEQDLEPDEDEEKSADTGDGGSILVISVEEGAKGARSSGDDFVDILSDAYDVTLWRLPDDGDPAYEDMLGYDAYIFDFGDFTSAEMISPAFLAMTNIEAGGIMLIGAQPIPVTEDATYADIDDLEVSDTEHPLLKGFDAEEIIPLLDAESDVESWVIPADYTEEEGQTLMLRGPDSPEDGSPALIVAEDDTTELTRIIIAAFPFYRLPAEAQETLALNAAAWLIGDED